MDDVVQGASEELSQRVPVGIQKAIRHSSTSLPQQPPKQDYQSARSYCDGDLAKPRAVYAGKGVSIRVSVDFANARLLKARLRVSRTG